MSQLWRPEVPKVEFSLELSGPRPWPWDGLAEQTIRHGLVLKDLNAIALVSLKKKSVFRTKRESTCALREGWMIERALGCCSLNGEKHGKHSFFHYHQPPLSIRQRN